MKNEMRVIHDDLLRRVADNTLVLPSPPDMVVSINKVLDDDRSTIRDVVDLISKNQVIAARILQVANSPALKIGNAITTIDGAVMRLGIALVKNIVLCLALKDKFNSRDPELQSVLIYFWNHSVDVAIASVLTSHLVGLKGETAMVVGLVHDIGVLPIIDYYSMNDKTKLPPIRETIDEIHSNIGASILNSWNFDYEIVSTIKYHEEVPHCFGKSKYLDLLGMIHLFLDKKEEELQVAFDSLVIDAGEFTNALTEFPSHSLHSIFK